MTGSMKIGLFAIGLDVYWEQFSGLKERLKSYLMTVQQRLLQMHPHVVCALAGCCCITFRPARTARPFTSPPPDAGP